MIQRPPARQYAEGEIFSYRGRGLKLTLTAGEPRGAPELPGDGRLVVRAADAEATRKVILYWYTSETEAIARALVPAWSKKLLVRPRSVVVKYARTRWGSCSSAGRIFLNARLAMLTDDVAEYVVVHELCHLKQMNHNREFWNEVNQALPGAMTLRRSLREQERLALL